MQASSSQTAKKAVLDIVADTLGATAATASYKDVKTTIEDVIAGAYLVAGKTGEAHQCGNLCEALLFSVKNNEFGHGFNEAAARLQKMSDSAIKSEARTTSDNVSIAAQEVNVSSSQFQAHQNAAKAMNV